MADPSVERETAIYRAELALETERFNDMMIEMAKVAKMQRELEVYERDMLSAAYKSAIGLRRASWRILRSKLAEEGLNTPNGNRVVEYREEVEKEMIDICGDIVGIIDNHLIPNCNSGDPAARAYYFKIKGDFNRYLAEFRTGDERKAVCDESVKAYETATDIARAGLPLAHPIRLSVALNFSAFYQEIHSLTFRAVAIAKVAFEDAMAGLSSLNDEKTRNDSILLMQKLWNNAFQWTHNLAAPAA